MTTEKEEGSLFFPIAGYFTGFVILCLALGWLVQGNDFFLAKVFSPKMEQVRRETFEESKAYNDGMAQELDNMRFEYLKANKDQQEGLKSVILHRVAAYDVSRLPPDLRSFIERLREGGGL